MKIGSRIVDAYLKTSNVGATSPAREAHRAAPAAAPSHADAAHVTISEDARALMAGVSAPVDHGKIDAIKGKIAEGTFRVDPQMVAKRIVDKLA